jgi:hypothetical protein
MRSATAEAAWIMLKVSTRALCVPHTPGSSLHALGRFAESARVFERMLDNG